MIKHKKYILAGLLSVTAIGGVAVGAQAMRDGGPMRADSNGDGVVSRSEFFAAAEARFKIQDANGDRQLAGSEMRDKRGRFARLDTNNDGKLTFAEEAAGTAARFTGLDADRDGKLTPEEIGARHGRGGPRGPDRDGPGLAQGPDGDRPAPGTMALQRLDTNGDGKITRAEMRAQADQRFDRLDANKDGAIDQAELQAQRDRIGGGRRGMMRQGMDDMPPPPPPAPAPGNQ